MKFILYAGDTTVCLSATNLKTLTENLNGKLSKMSI